MKLRGQIIKLENTRTVEIREGVELTIMALPLGFEGSATDVYPAPSTPQKYAEGPGGKVLRDPATKKPILVDDKDDPAYKKTSELAQRRQMMFILWEALKKSELEWDFVKNHSDPENPEFVDAMFQELKTAGFTMGDLAILMEEILKVSNLKDQEVSAAREGF